MSGVAAAADYKTEIRPTRSGDDPGQASGALKRATPVDGVRGASAKAGSPVEECLKLLARALQYFHTYPANSPMCVDAVTTCHSALGRVPGNERLVFVVDPRELRAGELKFGAGTVIEHELASRLHGARVSTIEIDRAASIRDLSRFCEDVHAPRGDEGSPTLAETLVEHGVDRIVLTMAHRPEVLHIGSPPDARTLLLAQERHRRESASMADGPSIHLYPPDTGWIRTDPGVELGSVSLPDLAILVDDPTTLATMLLRLADDGPEGSAVTPATALERKFSDVTKLFSVLEPRLARVMFAKLAGAVLSLDTNRRQNLLQKTVLPGLLDGEPDGAVLQDFPDVDLADALSLLLDVETAAPELLATALNRLELTAERRESMATLLEERVRTRLGAGSAGQAWRVRAGPAHPRVDSRQRGRVQVLRGVLRVRPVHRRRDGGDHRARCPHNPRDRPAGSASRMRLSPRAARAQPGPRGAAVAPGLAVAPRAGASGTIGRGHFVAHPTRTPGRRVTGTAPRRRRRDFGGARNVFRFSSHRSAARNVTRPARLNGPRPWRSSRPSAPDLPHHSSSGSRPPSGTRSSVR